MWAEIRDTTIRRVGLWWDGVLTQLLVSSGHWVASWAQAGGGDRVEVAGVCHRRRWGLTDLLESVLLDNRLCDRDSHLCHLSPSSYQIYQNRCAYFHADV